MTNDDSRSQRRERCPGYYQQRLTSFGLQQLYAVILTFFHRFGVLKSGPSSSLARTLVAQVQTPSRSKCTTHCMGHMMALLPHVVRWHTQKACRRLILLFPGHRHHAAVSACLYCTTTTQQISSLSSLFILFLRGSISLSYIGIKISKRLFYQFCHKLSPVKSCPPSLVPTYVMFHLLPPPHSPRVAVT